MLNFLDILGLLLKSLPASLLIQLLLIQHTYYHLLLTQGINFLATSSNFSSGISSLELKEPPHSMHLEWPTTWLYFQVVRALQDRHHLVVSGIFFLVIYVHHLLILGTGGTLFPQGLSVTYQPSLFYSKLLVFICFGWKLSITWSCICFLVPLIVFFVNDPFLSHQNFYEWLEYIQLLPFL